jgi:hypothetical protein
VIKEKKGEKENMRKGEQSRREREEEKGSGLDVTPLPRTLPRIDDIFNHLSDSEYFTTLDFKVGCFQISLKKHDRSETAFSTRGSQCQFSGVPQSIINSYITYVATNNKFYS